MAGAEPRLAGRRRPVEACPHEPGRAPGDNGRRRRRGPARATPRSAGGCSAPCPAPGSRRPPGSRRTMGPARLRCALAALLLALPAPAGGHSLHPPYFNLAESTRIAATATCGEDGGALEDLYCKLVGGPVAGGDPHHTIQVGQAGAQGLGRARMARLAGRCFPCDSRPKDRTRKKPRRMPPALGWVADLGPGYRSVFAGMHGWRCSFPCSADEPPSSRGPWRAVPSPSLSRARERSAAARFEAVHVLDRVREYLQNCRFRAVRHVRKKNKLEATSRVVTCFQALTS